MASLNLSINGPSIKSSYQGVVNGPAPSSTSSTSAQWALFSVQAPLLNAFQDSGAKESILKVETTGDGELADLIEDFNEGRIQFAYVKVKDPNTGLPKNVLIAWCGGGVPERTKGYFTSHVAAVAKVLHGYHVQITARSDSDLSPESILKKVADASGANYTAGGSAPLSTSAAPPVAKKPVFTPTASGSGSSFNPLVAARNRRQENVDDDGWGADAPQVTRTQIEKVESAYKPTRVTIADLKKNSDDSRTAGAPRHDTRPSDVVRGAYQPVGKVDIAAIRAQAKEARDDRPTTVKGSYEPVGKVDIAAIRAKAQRPAEVQEEEPAAPKSLAERSAAFTPPERLTELPKPKVAKKFGGSTFTGTKAPTPAPLGFGGPSVPAAPPVGAASRTFADQGGKTPAQIWAEKKARQGGAVGSTVTPPLTSPVTAQKSGGEWRSGYGGKSWAPVTTSNFGRGDLKTQSTGGTDHGPAHAEPEPPASPAGGISALRDRFKDAAPMGASTTRSAPGVPTPPQDEPAPPPPPMGSRPSGGFALPGLPSRPAAANDQEEEDDQERQREEEEEEYRAAPSHDYEERESSPVRIAMPVSRSAATELEPPPERLPTRPIPVPQDLPREEDLPEEEEAQDPRATAAAVADQTFDHATDTHAGAVGGGKRALIQYDYEKAEDNEIELREGEYVTNIEMVDDDWWMGTNSQGESGLFPSNYVELVDDYEEEHGAGLAAHATAPPAPTPAAEPEPELEHAASASGGGTATAQYDYEAAEDNELSFPEGATITGMEFPDEDWWFGHYKGASGLFPANYVKLDSSSSTLQEMYSSTPPVPPPKPSGSHHHHDHSRSHSRSHETSRISTPAESQSQSHSPSPSPRLPPPPPTTKTAQGVSSELPSSSSSSSAYSSAATTVTAAEAQAHAHAQAQAVADPGDQWLPRFLQDKSKQDLAEMLSSPTLLSALTHSSQTTHASLTSSNGVLQAALAENMDRAAHLLDLEAHLAHQRSATQAQLLSTHALERQWRAKQADMDHALAPFAPASLYQCLNQSLNEQEGVCYALEESFLEGDGDGAPATEKEANDWVRRYREAKKLYYLRQERKERWDEGRVGGWR
ncbi:hypothetical protein B0T22DRAFT_438251 [Podospora appendiculata]|uniref:Actin binding protein n=1 Tax=Podospora appendiculata TaxID=314037 RepID=A0AAE1C6T2_9PEZI|nr:hypothetical protein B0T22DRAFT_485940 [Podospora appendiculata]KAK3695228.1 hypothetical protein B0T22DRAFT_438251 [Podospora appendiculata]